jgi:hypothetical protein
MAVLGGPLVDAGASGAADAALMPGPVLLAAP